MIAEKNSTQFKPYPFPFQMLTKTILSGVRSAVAESRRGFGICVPAMSKATDPIQQLFLDRVREYKSKSK